MQKYLLFFIFISSYNLFAQALFYQKEFITYYNDKPIIIEYNNDNLNLFNGIVSQDGGLAAGIVINEELKEYIKTLYSGGIVDFYNLKEIILVVYSLSSNKILFQKKYDYFPYFVLESGGLIVFENDNNVLLYDLKKKKEVLLYQRADNVIYVFNNFLWNIRQIDKGIIVQKYNYKNNIFDTIGLFKYSNIAQLNFKIGYISKEKILLLSKEEDALLIHMLFNNGTAKIDSFKNIRKYIIKNNRVYFVGSRKSSSKLSLFEYSPEDESYFEIFSEDSQNNSFDFFNTNIVDIVKENDIYYFCLQSLFPEENNIFKFNVKNLSFEKMTNGFITTPIGLTN